MNNRDLAHRWANQTQDRGRGSHFFFEGRALYSYGYHFKVAEHVAGKPGHVFFTRDTYSSSTRRHQSHACGALRGSALKAWRVASFTDHAANVLAYLKDMEDARERALKARRWGEHYRDAAHAAATAAGDYAETFGAGAGANARTIKRRALAARKAAISGALFSDQEIAQVRERVAVAKEAAREQARKREAELAAQRVEALEKLDAWARGENVAPPSSWTLNLPTRLRLEDGGDSVVTSRGARISRRTAAALWAALCAGESVTGRELDGYYVRAWDGAALIVGCHTIDRGELVRMAQALDLGGALPAEGV